MEDLKPLEWLNNISILDQKPSTAPPNKKKKLSLSYLLQNFPSLRSQFRSPSRRPSFSYATLILLALHHSPSKQCSLSQIYNWIKATFPYYNASSTSPAWKNSIRHNLSLNKCFVKVPRSAGCKPGKGGFWRLDEACEEKLLEGDNFYRLRKKRSKKGKGGKAVVKGEEPRLEPIELEQVLGGTEEEMRVVEAPPVDVQGEEPKSAQFFYSSEQPPQLVHYTIVHPAIPQPPPLQQYEEEHVQPSAGAAEEEQQPAEQDACTEQQQPQPELNELNIVLEEYYYDPSGNGCAFEELELDIEHLISIGGF